MRLRVPMLDLCAEHGPIRDELERAIAGVIDSGHFILGPAVEELEAGIARCCGTRFAVGVSSGSDALLMALMALGVGPGDEVVTTAYSFFATAGCIARLGAKPIFVDIDPATYNIDPAAMAEAMSAKTKAVIPVHLFGQCADMAPILACAKSHDVPVIEDAAQAIGAQYRDGRRAGSMGVMGCFSFFPSKNLGAMGDAGMLTTNDEAIAERLRLLRNHGAKPKYHHRIVGGNFRIDTLQAAILNVKLKHLDHWTARRQDNAAKYCRLLAGAEGLAMPLAAWRDSGVRHCHIYNQFIVRATRRDALREFLKERGVATEIYYPVPLHQMECFSHLDCAHRKLLVAETAARETLALPISPTLAEGQIATVTDSVLEFLGCDKSCGRAESLKSK